MFVYTLLPHVDLSDFLCSEKVLRCSLVVFNFKLIVGSVAQWVASLARIYGYLPVVSSSPIKHCGYFREQETTLIA